jgi:hemerythrin-like domain-containing protein
MTMNTSGAPPLMQVKARVRADHARIRVVLDDLERELGRNDLLSKELTDAIWKLFLVLDDHLGMEERDLLPHLVAACGPTAIEHLQREHHEQRTVLLAMVNECDGGTTSNENIVDDAHWLIGSVRRDMDREDIEFDKLAPGTFLSDDGFVAEQCSG